MRKRYKNNIFIVRVSIFVLMFCSCFLSLFIHKSESSAYTAHTQAEAIAWVKSQVGKSVNGTQCVDLICAYYNYLGVSSSRGDGRDYATNALPSGWVRLQGAVPQQGDILVYSASVKNPAGHVAIFDSTHSTFHQNFDQHPYVEQITSYAYNGFDNPYWGVIRPDFSTDKTPPTISNVTVSNVTNEGYTVTCTVSDNVGISKVLFPSWNSDIHRGEDAVWLSGTVSGNTASCRVSASSLKSGLIQGNYATHIYAYDAAGNFVSAGCNAYIDRTAPQISDVSIVSLDGKGYTIRCKATDNVKIDRVQFPSWSHKGDQDDLASNWSTNTSVSGFLRSDGYYYFHLSNYLHNNEFGKYATHIYAYDAAGNYTVYHDDNTNNINIPQYALEFYSGMFEAHSKDVNMIFARLMPPAEEIRFQNIKMVTTAEKDGEILSVERDYGENTYSPYLKGGGYYQVVDNKDLKGATKNFKTSIYLTDENGETIECWYQYDPAQYKDTYYLTVNIGSQTEVQYPADYTSNEYYEEACGDIITPLECSSGGYDRTFTANKAGRAYIVGKNLLTGDTVIQVVDVIDPSDGSSYLKKDSSYQIKNGLLFGSSLKENTVQDVCSQFSQDNVICVDADGQALNSGDVVGTGTEIRIMNGEDILAECTVVIIGDIYGDGRIDSKDVSYLARYRLGKENLTDAQLAAADVYEDGKVDSKDVSKLARYRLGKDTISSQ